MNGIFKPNCLYLPIINFHYDPFEHYLRNICAKQTLIEIGCCLLLFKFHYEIVKFEVAWKAESKIVHENTWSQLILYTTQKENLKQMFWMRKKISHSVEVNEFRNLLQNVTFVREAAFEIQSFNKSDVFSSAFGLPLKLAKRSLSLPMGRGMK